MADVIIEDPERMNLLGLIFGNLIERQLVNPAKRQQFVKLNVTVGVQASEMKITLVFQRGQLRVFRGERPETRTHLRGSLSTLTQLALGKGLFRAVATRQLSFQGNLLALLRLRSLLSVS